MFHLEHSKLLISMIGKSDCNYARRGTLNKKYLLPISYKTDGLRKYRELLCFNVYQDHNYGIM